MAIIMVIPNADVTFMVITETIEPSYCYSPKLYILPPMRADMIIQGVYLSQLLVMFQSA